MSGKRQPKLSDFFARASKRVQAEDRRAQRSPATEGKPVKGSQGLSPPEEATEVISDSSDAEILNSAAARNTNPTASPPADSAAAAEATATPTNRRQQQGATMLSPFGEELSVEAAEKQWREALGDGWYAALREELQQPYFIACLSRVAAERKKHLEDIYPPAEKVFLAFKVTPLEKVKVVILGQDPYHQPGQAMGLCFSVCRGVKPPPSLVNIFKEIDRDLGCNSLPLPHGDLTSWASQGVLLLNSFLTVQRDRPMAHKDFGWARFTDKVLTVLSSKLTNVVFLLWGRPAQQKGAKLCRLRHKVLAAGHPSPLSVRHFAGCGHFLKCNEFLKSKNREPIEFRLKP